MMRYLGLFRGRATLSDKRAVPHQDQKPAVKSFEAML